MKESSRDGVCVPLQGWQLDCVRPSERVISGTQHKAGSTSILPANHRLYVKDKLWRLSHEPWALGDQTQADRAATDKPEFVVSR